MEYYLYIKAFHIIAFTTWMAMLFYLPRLFVYHAEHKNNTGFVEVVQIQEKKLYLYIGLPAVIATILSGVVLIWLNNGIFSSGGWLHAKLTIVFLLLIYHYYCGIIIRSFQNNTCNKSSSFFRIMNELPTIALVLIVVLAIAKPF